MTSNMLLMHRKTTVRVVRRFVSLLAISCLMLSLVVFGSDRFSVKGNPSAINVYPGPSAIQNAINSASPGDTVFVHNGTYYEHVLVNKSISLVGENEATTIIDGNKTGTVVEIRGANGVSIQGFTIGNSSQTTTNRTEGNGILISSFGNSIVNNRIIDNAIGVYLSSASSNNIVSGNTIRGNQLYGVYLDHAYSNTLLSNTVSDNQQYGIYLFFSYSNVISGNMITFNVYGWGVAMWNSTNNSLSDNTISNNYNGIVLLSSKENTIYHNNFMANSQHVYIFEAGYLNHWNYSGEGNFWSNYTGVDSNADGIGDTPQVIGINNTDFYPLMGRFSEFSVFLDSTAYYVSVISNSAIANFEFKVGAETGNRIITFVAGSGNSTIAFCRVRIPSELMQFPYILLIGNDEEVPRLLNSSSVSSVSYFVIHLSNKTVTIISSQLMGLYLDLQDKYALLNSTYTLLLNNYAILNNAYSILSANYTKLLTDFNNLNTSGSGLLENYTKLQNSLSSLNASHQSLLNSYATLQNDYSALSRSYGFLTGNYTSLQQGFSVLNQSYTFLVSNYNSLIFNYTRLQIDFNDLYNSQQNLLSDLSAQVQNIRNVIYIFVVTTAAFLAATVYLSKRAHQNGTRKLVVSE